MQHSSLIRSFTNRIAKVPHAFEGDCDQVSVLQNPRWVLTVANPCRRPSYHYSAHVDGSANRDETDDPRDIKDHVRSRSVLHQLAVEKCLKQETRAVTVSPCVFGFIASPACAWIGEKQSWSEWTVCVKTLTVRLSASNIISCQRWRRTRAKIDSPIGQSLRDDRICFPIGRRCRYLYRSEMLMRKQKGWKLHEI